MSAAPVARKPRSAQPVVKTTAVRAARSAVAPVDVTPRAPAVSAAESEAASPPAAKRVKLVRDSFTMPRADFDLVDMLKQRALDFRRPTKKSELLRAGLHALNAMDDTALEHALGALVPLKAGRPKKEG